MIPRIVFLFDVDNTLLDNDAIIKELGAYMTTKLGAARSKRYWEIFEECRSELGYADYLGALQNYRRESPHDPQLITISAFLLNYPFKEKLFEGAISVLHYVRKFGSALILTDGDVVFQPLKIHRSGIFNAVLGNVLIYVHKEQEVEDLERRFPADHYVFVDDKIRLLTAFKKVLGPRVTTVFPKQGHYASDKDVPTYPAADYTINHISEMLTLTADIVSKINNNR
ncbi:MAG: HAD family hydrolase [Gemmatimonadaceae bacterium]